MIIIEYKDRHIWVILIFLYIFTYILYLQSTFVNDIS